MDNEERELPDYNNRINEWIGIETEDTIGEEGISHPFDPTLVYINTKPMNIDLLLKRIEHNELDLQPSFQRRGGIWNKVAKSRLIESLLIRIPLPAFYIDATDDDKWLVVDGLQRLTTLKSFILDKTLRLYGLEYLTSLNGKIYADLSRSYQRRIIETQVTVYQIEKGTPPDVKFDIFKRINTGGLPLSVQEIRHVMNIGHASEILAELASSAEFKKAVDNSIHDYRMADRECVLRFCAFDLVSYRIYGGIHGSKGFDSFLNDCMETMNTMSNDEMEQLKQRFLNAMDSAYSIFGTDAFRKRYKVGAPRYPVNKALFESWSVNLSQLSDKEIHTLIERKNMLQERFIDLMNTSDFDEAISEGTGDSKKVYIRFTSVQKLIEEVLA